MSFCLLSLFIISRSVFVDAGVAAIDIETKKRKEEMKAREAQSRAAAEHGDLALITVEGPKTTTSEKIALRPPMLQVQFSTFLISFVPFLLIYCFLLCSSNVI